MVEWFSPDPGGPVRLLYVINSMEGGGAAAALPMVLGSLSRHGAEIRLVALTRRNGLAIPASVQAGFDPVVRAGGEKDHVAAARWLEREAREFGATHIFTSLSRATLLGTLVGRRLKIPVICWQHNAFLKLANERLLRLVAKLPLLWVADCEQVAHLTRHRLRLPADMVLTWPIFAADPLTPIASRWRSGEQLRIGSLGRLHSAKGYDLLIAALGELKRTARLPSCGITLDIAGQGDLRDQLEATARDQGLADEVRCAGFMGDPHAFLSTLHLYVQPSRREGFCIAAHEAMQAGLPALVTATGEMPYSVTEGICGRVVPVGDVAALTEALHDLLSRPEDLAAMGERSRAMVLTRFSLDQFDSAAAELVRRMRETVRPAPHRVRSRYGLSSVWRHMMSRRTGLAQAGAGAVLHQLI